MSKVVSVSELKENLSKYLRRVQRGGDVQVVSRGRPVARLVGMAGTPDDDDERRERLIAAGVLRAATEDVRESVEEPLRLPGADLSGSLDDERGDRV
jgi:prevent-host-death family protein